MANQGAYAPFRAALLLAFRVHPWFRNRLHPLAPARGDEMQELLSLFVILRAFIPPIAFPMAWLKA